VATKTAEPLTLPTIAEVQAAESKVGSALSDLDVFLHDLQRIAGRKAPDELLKKGDLDAIIAYEKPPAWIFDPETFARLLVLAGDLQEDARRLGADAEKLQTALLRLYRDRVIDPMTGEEPKRGDDA